LEGPRARCDTDPAEGGDGVAVGSAVDDRRCAGPAREVGAQ
jgi:hypothetical protein